MGIGDTTESGAIVLLEANRSCDSVLSDFKPRMVQKSTGMQAPRCLVSCGDCGINRGPRLWLVNFICLIGVFKNRWPALRKI